MRSSFSIAFNAFSSGFNSLEGNLLKCFFVSGNGPLSSDKMYTFSGGSFSFLDARKYVYFLLEVVNVLESSKESQLL